MAAVTAGCSILTADFDRIIAIHVETNAPTVEVGDTVRLVAHAVNAAGDVVLDAPIFWALLDVDSGQVGFTLDSASGLVRGVQPGAGRVQARVDDIRSDAVTVTVLAPAAASAVPRRRRHTRLSHQPHSAARAVAPMRRTES